MNIIFGNYQSENFEDSGYSDLAPVDTMENGDEYFHALNWAFKNDRIKNIALTGPYGAGKSSVIESFLKKNPTLNKRVLKISMATFVDGMQMSEKEETAGGQDGGEEKSKNGEKVTLSSAEIEEGILKQIFYKVNPKKIPQSRYRHLKKVETLSIWIKLVGMALLFTYFMGIFFPETIEDTLSRIYMAGARNGLPIWASNVVALVAVAYIIYVLAKVYKATINHVNVKKIVIPSVGEVDNAENVNENIFDKNLDEIVYFFEETKYQYIFFEDLDRLDLPVIFIHLRELNKILNTCDSIRRKVVFIYAVKDDIFTDNERTKFFDFILPIIPIINATNSSDVLFEKIRKSESYGEENNISQGFVLDVSPYIDDMRVLQNSYNEFLIYKKTLKVGQDLSLVDEWMMALIIFKNLYPKDFADLQAESGIVKLAFAEKEHFKLIQVEKWKSEYADIEKQLASYDRDSIHVLKELKFSFIGRLTDWKGWYQYSYNSTPSREEILEDTFDFSKLLELKVSDLEIYYTDINGSTRSTTCKNYEKIVREYNDRWNTIKEVNEEGKTQLLENARECLENIDKINARNTESLLQEFLPEEIFSDKVIKNKFLVFMLRRGYINEKYADYINYFKESSITHDDMKFILAVKNREPLSYEYTLTKVDMVIIKLQEYEFQQKDALNFDLLDQLLSNSNHIVKRRNMIKQLADESQKSWEFIDAFRNRTKYKAKFFQEMAEAWPGMWTYIYGKKDIAESQKREYLRDFLGILDVNTLKMMDSNKLMSVAIGNGRNVLRELSGIPDDKMINVINECGIIFSRLNIGGVSARVLDYIFDNNLYYINISMITALVMFKKPELARKIGTQNFTTCRKLKYKPLMENIQENLERYIDKIIMRKTNTAESCDAVSELLIMGSESIEMCRKVLTHEQIVFSAFDECCSSLLPTKHKFVEQMWNILLEQEKVQMSWENISKYWDEMGITDESTGYIDRHAEKLCILPADCLNDEGKKEIIINPLISESSLKKLLPILEVQTFDIKFSSIQGNRMAILIEQHYLQFNSELYNLMERYHPDLRSKYILSNQDAYVENMEEIGVDEEVFEEILGSDKLKSRIAQVAFDEYGNQYMNQEIAEIGIRRHLKFDGELLESAWQVLDNSADKKALLLNNLDVVDCEMFQNYVEDLSDDYPGFSDRSKRHNVEMALTTENEKLAQWLKQVGYISSYSIKEGMAQGEKHEDAPKLLQCKIRPIS